jgi:hypothetical protein
MQSNLAAPRERPLGVVVIAVFMVIEAVLAIGQILFDSPLSTRTETLLEISAWTPAAFVLLALVRGAAAIGLWMGLHWAWALAMLVVGASMVLLLYLYWLGDPSYPFMAIDVVIAFYLNQGVVRDYFEGPKGAPASGAGAGRG